jgi:hypothetical protein
MFKEISEKLKEPNTYIGIGSSTLRESTDVLIEIKKFIPEDDFKVNNKILVELKNGSRVICDKLDSNSFKGWSLDTLIIHDVDSINPKDLQEFKENNLSRLVGNGCEVIFK